MMKLNTNLTGMAVAMAAALTTGNASAKLVSHFSFDGDANNSVEGQHAGVENGTVSYVPGKFGKAASMAAQHDYIDLKSKTLGGIGTGNFTISLWVNLNDNTVSGDPAFFSNKDWESGRNQGINFAIKKPSDLQINARGGADTRTNPRVDFRGADYTDLPANGWHNIILVRDGDKVTYYYDGVKEKESKTIGAGADLSSAMNFILGDDGTKAYNNNGRQWSGDMLFDELSVYDTALTPEEIKKLQAQATLDK